MLAYRGLVQEPVLHRRMRYYSTLVGNRTLFCSWDIAHSRLITRDVSLVGATTL
jgi:hypothetical protein